MAKIMVMKMGFPADEVDGLYVVEHLEKRNMTGIDCYEERKSAIKRNLPK